MSDATAGEPVAGLKFVITSCVRGARYTNLILSPIFKDILVVAYVTFPADRLRFSV